MAAVARSRILPRHRRLCVAMEHGRTRYVQKELHEDGQNPVLPRFPKVRSAARRYQRHMVCLLFFCTMHLLIVYWYGLLGSSTTLLCACLCSLPLTLTNEASSFSYPVSFAGILRLSVLTFW